MIHSQTKLRFSPYLFEVSDELTSWTVRVGDFYVYGLADDGPAMRLRLDPELPDGRAGSSDSAGFQLAPWIEDEFVLGAPDKKVHPARHPLG